MEKEQEAAPYVEILAQQMVGEKQNMKQKTEKDKADLVVRKIIQGMETNAEDQQVFVNNAEYIEERLRDSLKVKGRL